MKRLGCLAALFFAALAVLAAAVVIRWQLDRALTTFGAPAEGIGWWTRWRLAHRMLASMPSLTTPVSATAGASFEITAGDTATAIAYRLEEAGLVPDAAAFLAYLRYKGWDTSLQSGQFRFQEPMTPIALAAALRERPPTEAVLVVLPGWRREEIAAALPTSGLAITPEDFLAATDRAAGWPLPITVPATVSLEGFLAPGRYTFPREATTRQVVDALLARSAAWMSPAWQEEVQAQGLTPYQGVILASIVQRETRQVDEMPLMASVYLNRLARGMPLEADPTVQYALGRPGNWWPSPLQAADLHTVSPYNTYQQPGLPPTPIANPGEAALQAVASAPSTDYLFFRAACDGSGRHRFARTYEEHLQNACP